MRCQCCLLFLITSIKTAGLCGGGRKKAQEKKGSQWVGRVELSLFVTPKIFNDANLINVICVAHRYVSSLVTIISSTGGLVALWQKQCEAAAMGSRSSSTALAVPWAPALRQVGCTLHTCSSFPLHKPASRGNLAKAALYTERVSCRQLFRELLNL